MSRPALLSITCSRLIPNKKCKHSINGSATRLRNVRSRDSSELEHLCCEALCHQPHSKQNTTTFSCSAAVKPANTSPGPWLPLGRKPLSSSGVTSAVRAPTLPAFPQEYHLLRESSSSSKASGRLRSPHITRGCEHGYRSRAQARNGERSNRHARRSVQQNAYRTDSRQGPFRRT